MSISMQAPPPVGHDVPTPPAPPAPRPRPRRGLWVLLLAVVAVGAVAVAAAVLLLRPVAPVDVSGTVVDARTGIGLQDVRVSGGLELVTTGAEGSFEVQAEPDVVLAFTAPGYEGSETAAAPTLVVELEPVVLTGKVSSAMTGRGLAATVKRDGLECGAADKDGAVTVYAVSPGDELVVETKGYLPGEVTVGSGDFTVELQPKFATTQAQIQRWVAADQYGKALRWVLPGDLDIPLMADSFGQQNVDETIAEEPEVFATGRSTTPMGSNDAVDIYVVKPGQAGAAMSGWTAEAGVERFQVQGQMFATGPHWDDSNVVVTMWWYDPLLVITFTDTADEAAEYLTAVLRNQGLNIDSLGQGGNTNDAGVQLAAVAVAPPDLFHAA